MNKACLNTCNSFGLHMHPLSVLPEGEEFAICTYILQKYAGLTFREATVYLLRCQFDLKWGDVTEGMSRQTVYSLNKKALRKIEECGEPVLDMIRPYVEKAPMLFIS